MNELISMGEVESFIDCWNSRHCTRVAEFERPFKLYGRKSVYVLLDYAPCPPDTERPETVAFICDKGGVVLSWAELCVSYAPDHETGMAECIEMLEAMQ